MLPRFCKLCYQVVDESVINFRRFSVKHSKATLDYYSDTDNEQQFNEQELANPEENVEQKPKKKQFIIQCKRPQFNFYKGDVLPKFKAIPLASRGWHHRKSVGDYFTIYPSEHVEEDEVIDTTLNFEDLKLNEGLLENLEANNYYHPTEIQRLGIPKILSGQNVALTAETGCGKTCAFLIPLLNQILQWKPMLDRGVNRPLAIILTPSKELTLQIAKVAKMLSKNLDINIVKLVGVRTKKMISNPPVTEVDLVIATIGVMSKLVTTNIYKLDQVRHIVMDEADTLLDESFSGKICHFLNKIPLKASRNPSLQYPGTAQLTLNSATIPQNMSELLRNVVDPDSITTITTGYEHQIKVPQKFLRLNKSEKPVMLLKFVKPKAKSKTPVIIFSNNTATCDYTSIFLKQNGINCVNMHKNMPREMRKGKINAFINGNCHVLTTTDAGARGIDTTVAKDVINFDFPLITAEYIHRCGRVGRIGSPKDCRVINFISKPLEIVLTSKIEFAARKQKPIPMVDFIHNQYDEDGQFLHSDEMNENFHQLNWDEDGDDNSSNVEDNEDHFTPPH